MYDELTINEHQRKDKEFPFMLGSVRCDYLAPVFPKKKACEDYNNNYIMLSPLGQKERICMEVSC